VVLVFSGGEEGQTLTVLAMNDDPEASRQAVLYVGDPEDQPLELPEGEYALLAMDADGNVARVHASLAADGLVPLQELDFDSDSTEEERAADRENMEKVLEFFAVNEYSVLSYVERMLRTGGDLSDDDVAAQFDEMAALQVSLESAIVGLQYFSEESSARRASEPYVLAMPPRLLAVPRPAPGVVSVLWELWKFGKTLTGAAEDSRKKVVEGMQALPDDNHRQQLLNEIDPERRRALGIPDNASDFMRKLEDGDLDHEASQIHQELCDASQVPSVDLIGLSNYIDHAQNTDSRPIDQAHKHGEKMVEQGTKFNLQVWKEVIGGAQGNAKTKAALQGAIDKGILTYDLVVKPGDTLTKEGIKKILESQLKDKLRKLGVPADEIGGIIGVLADKLFDRLKAKDPSLVADEEDEDEDDGEAVLSPPRPEDATPPAPPSPTAAAAVPTRVPSAVPTTAPQATAAPPTATVPPDTSWIEPFVQSVANQLLDAGYSGIDVAVAVEELRACLYDFALDGWTKEDALYFCQDVVYSLLPQEPTATREPAPAATSAPQPTATPQPAGGQMTVVGQLRDSASSRSYTTNSITVTFDSGGGTANGQAHLTYEYDVISHPGCVHIWDWVMSGSYSPETGLISGTVTLTRASPNCGGPPASAPWTEDWYAGWDEGKGELSGCLASWCYYLTVQG
jgi:hypothetical protein